MELKRPMFAALDWRFRACLVVKGLSLSKGNGGGGVTGWDDASETFNVTLELVRRGYNEDEIRKIWGENTLRVWKEVEQVVAKLQQEDAE
jgi:hypothetical protein